MNHLGDIIPLMNKEEIRGYKIFSERIQFENSDRKIIDLFHAIKNETHQENDKELVKKLFGANNMNAHYRLKNRLKDDIERSLLLHHTNLDEKVAALNLLILSKICFYKSAYWQAYNYLKQAEKIAKAKQYFDILNSIYDEMLVLCRFYNDINPNEINQLQSANAHQYLILQKTNALIATLNYQLRQSNYSGKDKELTKAINKAKRQLNLTEKNLKTPETKFQIHDCVKNALLQNKDFKALENYLIKSYKDFSKQKLFNKELHDKKIVLLIWIINSKFKNKKPKETEPYLKLLFEALQQFNKIHFDKYYGSYIFSRMYYLIYTNQLNAAIEILLEFKKHSADKGFEQNMFNINLNLCTLYFYQNNFNEALKTLGKLFLKDSFQQLSMEWKLSISLLEIIFQYANKDFNFAEMKLTEVKRTFKMQLKQENFEKENLFIQIIGKQIKSKFASKKNATNNLIESFIKKYKTVELGSNEAMNYTLFLKGELENQTYYSLLLEDINHQ
jgi:hypothetical protein